MSNFKSLDNVLMIVSSYGDVLESLSALVFKPESALPYSKDIIKKAIIAAHHALGTSDGRRFVHENYRSDIAKYLLAPNFRERLASGIMFLSDFVPDEEAALGNHVMGLIKVSSEQKNIELLLRIPEEQRDKVLQLQNRVNEEGGAFLAELNRMSPMPRY